MSSNNNPETTAATAAKAKDNLALRFSYEQLDTPHRAIADEVAKLVLAYPDIVKLNDPAAEAKFKEDVQKSGVDQALANGGDMFKVALGKVRAAGIPILSDSAGALKTANDARENVGAVAAGAAAGVSASVAVASAPTDAAFAFLNESKVIFNDMTPERARALATEYASVLQSQQVERSKAGFGGMFAGFKHEGSDKIDIGTGFGNMWAYISAAVAWAADTIGHLINKDSETHSFAEHLSRAFNKADIDAVRASMTEVTSVKGSKEWGQLFTEGGENQNPAGTNTPIAAPTMEKPVPTAPDAPQNADGSPVVAAPDAGAALNDAQKRAGLTIQQKINNIFHDFNSPERIMGGALGLSGLTWMEHRFAPIRGLWNGGVHAVAGTAKMVTDFVLGAASGVAHGTAKLVGVVLPDTDGLAKDATKVLKQNVEIIDKAGNKAAALAMKEGKKHGLMGDALTHAVEEARAVARKEASEGVLKSRGLLSKSLDGLRPAGDAVKHADKHGHVLEGLAEGAKNWVDGVHDFLVVDRRNAAKKAADAAKEAAQKTAEAAVKNVPEASVQAAKAAHADSLAGKAEAFAGEAKKATGEFFSKWTGKGGAKAVEETAELAAKAAPKVGKAFKFAKFLGKSIPFVGAGVVALELTLTSGANAAEVDGKKLSMREQLIADYVTGRISKNKYDLYKNLQDKYVLTGLGGIITAGVVEIGQDGISELDKASMLRYLPTTLADTIREMHGEKLPAIAPAVASVANTAAERQQRMAIVNHDVQMHKMMEMIPGNLPSLDSTVNWGRIEKAIQATPVAAAQPAPLTHAELAKAHGDVIQQARMATSAGRTGANKPGLVHFNLGTAVSTTVGAVLPNGLPHHTGGQQVATAAAKHSHVQA